MIHCNLATLLAQRNLKISKVYQDTGISRTTLTALAYNHAQGIQFETLNTLCTYLKVSPTDLILHVPVGLVVSVLKEIRLKHHNGILKERIAAVDGVLQ